MRSGCACLLWLIEFRFWWTLLFVFLVLPFFIPGVVELATSQRTSPSTLYNQYESEWTSGGYKVSSENLNFKLDRNGFITAMQESSYDSSSNTITRAIATSVYSTESLFYWSFIPTPNATIANELNNVTIIFPDMSKQLILFDSSQISNPHMIPTYKTVGLPYTSSYTCQAYGGVWEQTNYYGNCVQIMNLFVLAVIVQKTGNVYSLSTMTYDTGYQGYIPVYESSQQYTSQKGVCIAVFSDMDPAVRIRTDDVKNKTSNGSQKTAIGMALIMVAIFLNACVVFPASCIITIRNMRKRNQPMAQILLQPTPPSAPPESLEFPQAQYNNNYGREKTTLSTLDRPPPAYSEIAV